MYQISRGQRNHNSTDSRGEAIQNKRGLLSILWEQYYVNPFKFEWFSGKR